MKPLIHRLKPYLRWVILGGALFFVAQSLKDHWREVAVIQITALTWACLISALGVTLLAHIWSGWVWHWILQSFDQPLSGTWSVQVYLKTNIAKYLPGNVWHFYGRVRAVQATGAKTGTALLSVVMEPLLMAAAALSLASVSSSQTWVLQSLVLAATLVGIHPRVFNPVLKQLSRVKAKAQQLTDMGPAVQLRHYPLKPLLGELGFVVLRGTGFILTVVGLQVITWEQVLPLFSAFSIAWLLGLVVPGAPSGIGVFEATAIALLDGQFSAGLILSSVALYRLISTLAEVGGAGLVWLDERLSPSPLRLLAESSAVEQTHHVENPLEKNSG